MVYFPVLIFIEKKLFKTSRFPPISAFSLRGGTDSGHLWQVGISNGKADRFFEYPSFYYMVFSFSPCISNYGRKIVPWIWRFCFFFQSSFACFTTRIDSHRFEPPTIGVENLESLAVEQITINLVKKLSFTAKNILVLAARLVVRKKVNFTSIQLI